MPRTNKRTCSTCAIVVSTLGFEPGLVSAENGDAMCCMGGEKRVVAVREESGLEMPAAAISRLA